MQSGDQVPKAPTLVQGQLNPMYKKPKQIEDDLPLCCCFLLFF